MNFVVTHPEYGVFVGCCILCFWSKIDSVGQPAACTFATKEDAWAAAKIAAPEGFDQCKIVPVNCEGPWADIAVLKEAAGLGDLLGDMEQQALLYAEPMGSA